MSAASADGIDSDPFDINVNGVETTWNLSIRFWTGEDGERLTNPFVLCLNMLRCNISKPVDVGVKFTFGVHNRINDVFEMASSEVKPRLRLETSDELRSIGYKNMAVSEKHFDSHGGINLVCKMRLLKDDLQEHSLSSDLKVLLNDEKSSDLAIEAGGKSFRVHKNILAVRSPVLARLISQEEASSLQQNEVKDTVEKETPAKKGNAERQEEEKVENTKPTVKTLHLHGMSSETLGELLSYIYTDSSSSVSGMTNSLLAAAERYQLLGLKNHCERHLQEVLRPANVASVLLLAEKFKCQGLKQTALDFCQENHTYIMKDDQWKVIEEEKPDLFQEAVAKVVDKDLCECHSECLKVKGKRFEFEKNSSTGCIVEEPRETDGD